MPIANSPSHGVRFSEFHSRACRIFLRVSGVPGPTRRASVLSATPSAAASLRRLAPDRRTQRSPYGCGPILHAARSHGAFIHFDMEQYAFKDLTLRIFRQILEEDEFHDWPNAGIALQALMAPAYAVPRMLSDAHLALQDFDFYEIHEAFAGQVLCTLKAWADPCSR